MRFFILLFIFSGFLITGYGQSTNEFKLPEILPPSPDVAALAKGGELSATPNTGAPNASIPVYNLKVGSFSLPLSLGYSSNGFKPEEVPSRVGIGWHLNAGGCVSRMVKGKPDDYCTAPTSYLTESQLLQYNSTAYSFLVDLEDQTSYHDGQPDEYTYNVNGLSGKFIIQRDGGVLQIPYNNVKITVARNAGAVTDIYVTDGNGIKYSFGQGEIEQTLEHNLVNNYINKQSITTAWMLTRVTLPDGNYITFSYGSINHYVQSGVMESVRKGIVGAYCTNQNGPPTPCSVDPEYSTKTSVIRYSSRYLTAINTNTGPAVAISYVDRPDAGGDNRVDQIIVSNGFGTTIKNMKLEYVDRHVTTSTPYNEGFFLKRVLIKNPADTSAADRQVFELSYVDEANTGAGATITKNIDHLGFANGANNSTLLPANTSQAEMFVSYGTANREPNGLYAQKGMLETIKYPTGGYDQFYYEPNKATWWDSVNISQILTARNQGYGDVSPYHFYYNYFTVPSAQTGEIYLSTSWYGSPPIPDGDPAPKVAFARLYNDDTHQVVAERIAYGFPGGAHYTVDGPSTVNLQPGINYKFELEVRYGTDAWARGDVVYDAGTGKQWLQLNEEYCGVRVHKIGSYDPVSRKTVYKFYTYRSLTDTTHASAQKLYYPEYVSGYDRGMFCNFNNLEVTCNGYVLSSNSGTTLYGNEAAGVVYKWVIESDDSTFANGGIEHSYYIQGGRTDFGLMGNSIPDPPMSLYNYMNGVDTVQRYFNKNRLMVRKVNNYYSTDSRINGAQYQNYIVRKRYDKVQVGAPWDENDFNHFDVSSYTIYTGWDHLDSTVTREYDLENNKVLISKTAFTYGNSNNIQPTASKTYDSDNSELRKEMKYPTDLTAQAVCSTLVAKNIIDPALEEKTYKDSKLLYQRNTDYKDWFSNGATLEPELIKGQKSTNSQETRIHFYQYDTKGNVLELSKENDIRISYIWDYNSTLPIAEVTNASWGSGIAYTSFESDGKGGWTFSGTPATEGSEPAGKKSYALTDYNITYGGTLTSGKKYYVTYWNKGGTVSVNGASGTSMLSKNGWTLFRHTITYSGSGGITVSAIGTAFIDELRLYPDLSFMKTFTYTPEVGVTTMADNNAICQRYEYDNFNRLLRIRDMDNNILKQHEYKFGSNVTGCVDTNANWQVTGNYRCAKTSEANNNNTGVKEREEVNMNNCSGNYGEARWVSVGTSSECPVVSNCTGIDKRVINGTCVAGCKQLVKSQYLGNLSWQCTFHYVWPDGYVGPTFTETGNYYCIGTVCDL